jgi:large subunit ribosomal protein L13
VALVPVDKRQLGQPLTFAAISSYHLGLPSSDTKAQGTSRMRTYVATPKTIARRWHVIDAQGKALGRVATQAARLLQGKHKATYTPFLDTGDHVVIVNVGTVRLTGRKETDKVYRRHSGYSGGLREERASVVRKRQPVRLLEHAVRGMLPKSRLGDAMYRKLKVYAGKDHPHAAQQPTPYEVE